MCDYEWQLRGHLLPFFGNHRLSQITIAEVDRYRGDEGAESPLGAPRRWRSGARASRRRRTRPGDAKWLASGHAGRCGAVSINKTITRLGQILEVAVEYGLIAPATRLAASAGD